MDREDVNLIHTHEPIDDPVRWMNHLTNERGFEFRNGPTRFREGGYRPVAAISWATTTDA